MSITKVSRISGVSIATVSRVINRQGNVAPGTAAAVEAAIAQIGYLPPLEKRVGRPRRRPDAPRPPATRSGTVALLFADTRQDAMRTRLSGRLLHGIEDALWRRSMVMTLMRLTESGELPPQLNSRQVDGVIVRNFAQAPHQPAARQSLPRVHLFEPLVIPEVGDMVLEDNPMIGAMAADHLVSAGHKKLVFLNPFPAHPSFTSRAHAFAATARRHDVHLEMIDGPEDPYKPIPRFEAQLEPLLDRFATVAARGRCGVFVPGRDADLTIIFAGLARRGLIVGRDLDLVCCHNDFSQVQAVAAGSAVIDIHPELMGEVAVDVLLWRLANPAASRRRVMVEPALLKAEADGKGQQPAKISTPA